MVRALTIAGMTLAVLFGTAAAAAAEEDNVCNSPVTVYCGQLLGIDPTFNFDIFPE